MAIGRTPPRPTRHSRRNAAPATCLFLVCIGLTGIPALGCGRAFVHVERQRSSRKDKAVLVLPGLGNGVRGRRAAKRWYPDQGYDVFIPDYITDRGFAGHLPRLRAFIERERLESYREVYAFVYLLGGWTLNRYLEAYPFPNLKRIVYDRSPLQEQAPRIVMENIPRIIRMLYGITVADLRDTPYPPLPKGNREIGIMVECRATPYVRRHRDQLRPLSDRDWTGDGLNQSHDDLIYVHLHHLEMYYSFDTIGDELRSFFDTGKFTTGAVRTRIRKDPFD